MSYATHQDPVPGLHRLVAALGHPAVPVCLAFVAFRLLTGVGTAPAEASRLPALLEATPEAPAAVAPDREAPGRGTQAPAGDLAPE